uniref:Uncharacterized protein n=1 Tax=Rhizophora mucronata TaxID=61149 RepID=A0A2P2QXZ8_RHIMU
MSISGAIWVLTTLIRQ